MGLMRTAAVKGMIPPGNKVSELRNNLMRLMTTMAVVMEERFGKDGLDAVAETFRRLGTEDADTLKDRLDLGETLKDAEDAWMVIGHIMGSKMVSKWIDENRVEFSHPFCPQYQAFKEYGKLYCESVCWPYVESVAVGIAKGARMEITRSADSKGPCTKAIVASK
ncbi:MAG: hypothetical protein ACFFF4_04815 [Candidatus Thorarchaeota archaeon]